MKIRTVASLAFVILVAGSIPAFAQKPQQAAAQGADFTGVWYPSTAATLGAATPDNPGPSTSSYDSNDPDFQCFPSGVPRIYLFLYPIEFVHTPGRVLILFEYGHNIRQIFTDGRGHAQDEEPTWMGDSIGHWEGDTLVAETIGLNDKTWFGYGGQPHSEALRVVERFRRLDHDSLMIDITLDDPKAYTTQLHTQKKYILKPDWNIKEFVCEDGLINFRDYEKKVAIPQPTK